MFYWLELLLKLVAFGLSLYWKSFVHRLDVLILMSASLGWFEKTLVVLVILSDGTLLETVIAHLHMLASLR